MYKSQFWKIDPYDWFCGPGSQLSLLKSYNLNHQTNQCWGESQHYKLWFEAKKYLEIRQWLCNGFNEGKNYNPIYKPDSKKVGTLYKLWIKTECNDVEVSNFNFYSEYNIDDISNV